MFIPNHFQNNDRDDILEFIRQHSFGQLISMLDGRSVATHIPFLLSEDNKRLIAHVAKANPQWRQFGDQEVLITLAGPHAYVSPSWYATGGVPTWNYQAVHIYGKVSCTHDGPALKTIVDQLTLANENHLDQPWQPDFDERMLNGIVGIELEIEEIQCKYKLSQNRPLEEQEEVANKLEESGNNQMADAMRAQSRKNPE